MSFNRTTYDNCSYKQELQGNVSTLSYLLSPYRYEHENKCRHQLVSWVEQLFHIFKEISLI